MFDANLNQSNTHNYTCLTVRVKASVQSLLSIIMLQNMLNKPYRIGKVKFIFHDVTIQRLVTGCLC